MIKPEQVPHEVAKLLEDQYLDHGDIYKATAAALSAWPGMCHAHNENGVNVEWATWYALPWHRANASEGIILPFTENTNAEG